MKKFGDLIKALKNAVDNDTSDRLVKKAIPATPEWIASMAALDTLNKQRHEIENKIHADRKKLWAQIELGMDDFSTDKRWNDETNEVEILVDNNNDDDNDKSKPVKSPFQTGEL